MGGARVNSGDVLKEIQALRQDLQTLSKLLIGCADEPDKPGLMERMRVMEMAIRLVRWVAGIIAVLIISDVVTRILSWYKGGP